MPSVNPAAPEMVAKKGTLDLSTCCLSMIQYHLYVACYLLWYYYFTAPFVVLLLLSSEEKSTSTALYFQVKPVPFKVFVIIVNIFGLHVISLFLQLLERGGNLQHDPLGNIGCDIVGLVSATNENCHCPSTRRERQQRLQRRNMSHAIYQCHQRS